MKIHFGSVWKVLEDVWKRAFSGYKSERVWHPGLSIYRGDQPPHPYQKIPMLIGVTEPRDSGDPIGFELGDPAKGKGFTTYFTGKVGPVPAILFDHRHVDNHPGGERLSEVDLERLEQWGQKHDLIN